MTDHKDQRPSWCPDHQCRPLASVALEGLRDWGWCMGKLAKVVGHYDNDPHLSNDLSWCVFSDVGHKEVMRLLCNRDDVISWITTQGQALQTDNQPLPGECIDK